jgi:hypothetical protein
VDTLSDLNGDNNHRERGYYDCQRQTRSGENPAHSKTKNQRYSEQYLKILQNSFQSNGPIGSEQPGALLEGSKESVDGARCLGEGLSSPICRAKVAAKTLLSGPTSSFRMTSSQVLDGHVQCVQTGLLHEGKRIRRNGHEC